MLQRHIEGIHLGMLELSSRDLSLEQNIKLILQLSHTAHGDKAYLRESPTSRFRKSEIVVNQAHEASVRQWVGFLM